MQGVVYDLKNLDAEGVSVQYGDITLKLPLASCRVKATSLKTWMLKVSLYNTVMSHWSYLCFVQGEGYELKNLDAEGVSV